MGCKGSKAERRSHSPQETPQPEQKYITTEEVPVAVEVEKEEIVEEIVEEEHVVEPLPEPQEIHVEDDEEEEEEEEEEDLSHLIEEAARNIAASLINTLFKVAIPLAAVAVKEKWVKAEKDQRDQLKSNITSIFDKEISTLEWDIEEFKIDVVAGFAKAFIVNHLNIADFIKAMDVDGDGMLGLQEFSNGIEAIEAPVGGNDGIERLFADIDKNGDGKLSYLELSAMRNSHREKNESSLRKHLSGGLSPLKELPNGALIGNENSGINSTPKGNTRSEPKTSKTTSTPNSVKKSANKKSQHKSRQAFIEEQRLKKLANANKGKRNMGQVLAQARSTKGEKRVHPFLDPKGTGTPPRARKQFNTPLKGTSCA